MRRGRFSVWLQKMTGFSSVYGLVGVNSICGVQSKRKHESIDSCVCIAGFSCVSIAVFSCVCIAGFLAFCIAGFSLLNAAHSGST